MQLSRFLPPMKLPIHLVRVNCNDRVHTPRTSPEVSSAVLNGSLSDTDTKVSNPYWYWICGDTTIKLALPSCTIWNSCVNTLRNCPVHTMDRLRAIYSVSLVTKFPAKKYFQNISEIGPRIHNFHPSGFRIGHGALSTFLEFPPTTLRIVADFIVHS